MIVTFKEDEERIFAKIMAALSDEPQITTISTATAAVLSFPGLIIYPYRRQVWQNETEIHLTYLEFEALHYLAQNPGRIFTKEQIYQHLHRDEPMEDIDNLIYCLIRSLRKKLESDPRHPKYIITVRGIGYKFMK